MKNLVLGKEILGKSPRLVGYAERFAFTDGKRGEQVGLWLEVLLPENGFEKLRVACSVMSLPVSQEEIDARNAQFAPFKVDFDGFTATPYVDRSGRVAYSAKAETVKFLDVKEG